MIQVERLYSFQILYKKSLIIFFIITYYIYRGKVSFLRHQIYNHYYCIKVCELREFDNKVHNYSLLPYIYSTKNKWSLLRSR